jgi:hypothetical protein
MGTGGAAGTWYPVGGVLAASMSKSGSVSVTAQTSAASIENINLAASGDRQLGIAATGLIVYASLGQEMFSSVDNETKENYTKLRAIANMMPNQFQFVVRADSGINSIEDMVGKKVGTGAPGSGDEVFARGIIEAFGIYNDVTPAPLSFAEQVTEFKNKKIDVIFVASPAPTAAIMDAASQADCKLISFTPEEIEVIKGKFPFAVEATIPAGAYNFVTKDVNTLCVYSTLFTTTDVSEEVVYAITKAMFEDLETINAAHPAVAKFSAETAIDGLGGLELHPGAQKYYEELGLL